MFLEQFPYLTEIHNKKFNTDLVILIQSVSKNFLSYYNVDKLNPMDIERFNRLANNWWKNSPNIPISLYYKDIFNQFEYCKEHISNGDYDILSGFEGIKLKNLSDKRIKRKIIHLE